MHRPCPPPQKGGKVVTEGRSVLQSRAYGKGKEKVWWGGLFPRSSLRLLVLCFPKIDVTAERKYQNRPVSIKHT